MAEGRLAVNSAVAESDGARETGFSTALDEHVDKLEREKEAPRSALGKTAA